MPVDELAPPVGYPGWWTAVGVAILLAVLAASFFWVRRVLRRTQPGPEEAAPPAPATPGSSVLDPFARLREEYDQRLDAVAHRYAAGELDDRSLHLTLSSEVRGFATRRTGRDATVLTLSEIEQVRDADELARLIARYYRPSFSEYDVDPRDARYSAEQSIERARQVVRTW